MKLGILQKCRMRARSFILSAIIAASLPLLFSIARAEEDELYELKENEYNKESVCDFINARIYEVESRIEDTEENLPFDESITFDPIFEYRDDFILAKYIVLKFSNILIASIEHLVIDAIYMEDKDKSRLLSRLGINTETRDEKIFIRCDDTHAKLTFNKETLKEIQINVFSVD